MGNVVTDLCESYCSASGIAISILHSATLGVRPEAKFKQARLERQVLARQSATFLTLLLPYLALGAHPH